MRLCDASRSRGHEWRTPGKVKLHRAATDSDVVGAFDGRRAGREHRAAGGPAQRAVYRKVAPRRGGAPLLEGVSSVLLKILKEDRVAARLGRGQGCGKEQGSAGRHERTGTHTHCHLQKRSDLSADPRLHASGLHRAGVVESV